MTLYLIVALFAVSAGLLVTAGMAGYSSSGERQVNRQLATIRRGDVDVQELRARRRRQARSDRLRGVLQAIAGQMDIDDDRTNASRRTLQRAGIRHRQAVTYYYAARVVLAVGLGTASLTLGGAAASGLQTTVMTTAATALAGWFLPAAYIRLRVGRRQKELQQALPDTLDLLVVCVESGLGLNQAMARVSDEVGRMSSAMCDELTLVNLEIRAGAARPDALRNLWKRTGVSDIQSLVGMLIQTDRFGTSVARGLRVHSDSLRTKRRQRAEEAAAKTPIKMLFPLVFFIFPALFVVILGPAIFKLGNMFGTQ